MEKPCCVNPLVLVLVLYLCKNSSSLSMSGNETDREALLDLKKHVTQDPLGVLSSWNDSVHLCNWAGVTCNSSSGRVANLTLHTQRLVGSLPSSIGNLTFLTVLNLEYNGFVGEIPDQISRLSYLEELNLTSNYFTGKLPRNLTTRMRIMGLSLNAFVGDIPDQLGSLTNLVVFSLGGNNLTGSIPAWLGNFSSLFGLSLALNNLVGSIPDDLGKLRGLGKFQIYGNFVSGSIPASIFNISSMYYFSVTQNQLYGRLPQDVGLRMPGLQVFAGGVNNFTGPIPGSLSNATGLQVLDFAQNGLTGTIPENLGSLANLVRLNFDENLLGSWEADGLEFISSLANITTLEVLGLARNRFGGELPASVANLSNLQILTLGENSIRGRIPVGIVNLVNLTSLGLEGNLLIGNVPDTIGMLQNLQGLHMHANKLSGSIPSTIGNLTRLTRLFFEENRLEGSIPSSLGSCTSLQNLNLSSNNFNGTIPKEVIGLASLSISLVMSCNSLTGPLPPEVGNLVNLVELDLSGNNISGIIPSNLGSCVSLERLHLENNRFEGEIPPSFQSLRGMVELDLSHNNLSGTIPEFLSSFLFLQLLNLSYNRFNGAVPMDGIFANDTAFSVLGDNDLCDGVPALQLRSCSGRGRRKSRMVFVVVLSVCSAFVFVVILFGALFLIRKARNSRTRRPTELPFRESEAGMSYSDIMKATDNLSTENWIGSGSFGSVYKGVLSVDGKIAAVKVINLQQRGASASFIDECNALRSLRHRNLLRIIDVCSSVDRQGNDFKAIVFELMPNGSLDKRLHPRNDDQSETNRLSFLQRLNIAIDVACALDYLHNHYDTPIVHCDLKPSNVLLDKDMTAHVGDFGLAKILQNPQMKPERNQAVSDGLKGSIGYIPPEYGSGGQVSTLGDTYSFGILLQELFTGRSPLDEMFKDDLNIRKFVKMSLPGHVMEIIDPSMILKHENPGTESSTMIQECLVSILEVGLDCSMRLPGKRTTINFVVNKLQDIRDFFFKSLKTIPTPDIATVSCPGSTSPMPLLSMFSPHP